MSIGVVKNGGLPKIPIHSLWFFFGLWVQVVTGVLDPAASCHLWPVSVLGMDIIQMIPDITRWISAICMALNEAFSIFDDILFTARRTSERQKCLKQAFLRFECVVFVCYTLDISRYTHILQPGLTMWDACSVGPLARPGLPRIPAREPCMRHGRAAKPPQNQRIWWET